MPDASSPYAPKGTYPLPVCAPLEYATAAYAGVAGQRRRLGPRIPTLYGKSETDTGAANAPIF